MDKATKTFIEEQTEKLAAMVAKGFASTATRDEMNERFGKVDERLETLEAMLGRRYQELDELRGRMRILETRVDNLETVHR